MLLFGEKNSCHLQKVKNHSTCKNVDVAAGIRTRNLLFLSLASVCLSHISSDPRMNCFTLD
jgi:hypothetical protein